MVVAYLNRWGHTYHLMLAVVDGDVHRRIASRFVASLGEARTLLAHWQQEHAIATENVRDNSGVDLDDLLAWMEVDFDGQEVSEVAGVVH